MRHAPSVSRVIAVWTITSRMFLIQMLFLTVNTMPVEEPKLMDVFPEDVLLEGESSRSGVYDCNSARLSIIYIKF